MKKQQRSNIIPFRSKGYVPSYPNAATPKDHMNKVIDCALTLASSAGFVVSVIFIIVML